RSPAPVLPPVPDKPVDVKPKPVKTLLPEINLTAISMPSVPPGMERSISKKMARMATGKLGRISARVDANAPVYPGTPDSWIDRVLDPEMRDFVDKNAALITPTCFSEKGTDLGTLVGEGPFFMFLKGSDPKYTLDLSALSLYEHHLYCHDTGS